VQDGQALATYPDAQTQIFNSSGQLLAGMHANEPTTLTIWQVPNQHVISTFDIAWTSGRAGSMLFSPD
jgi:hypothetical protein